MVITPKFVIGHIAKTGGDAMHQICAAVFEAGLQHEHACDTLFGSIKNRPFTGEENVRACTFRRLPSYLLSWAHHMKNLGGEAIWSKEHICTLRTADDSLNRMTTDMTITVHYWLRCEWLRDDLIDFFIKIYGNDFTPRYKRIVENTPTKEQMKYNHSIWKNFTKPQVQQMYNNNPVWAAVERTVYGKLMI